MGSLYAIFGNRQIRATSRFAPAGSPETSPLRGSLSTGRPARRREAVAVPLHAAMAAGARRPSGAMSGAGHSGACVVLSFIAF